MCNFNDRSNREEEVAKIVETELLQMNFAIEKFGQETGFSDGFRSKLLACGNNATARFLRYRPDRAIIDLVTNKAYLCEIKSGSGTDHLGKKHEDFCYELDSWLAAKSYLALGVLCFVVFGDLTAAWVDSLRIRDITFYGTRVSWDEYYRSGGLAGEYRARFGVPVHWEKRSRTGSDTPMVKIPRCQFIPLVDFIQRIRSQD